MLSLVTDVQQHVLTKYAAPSHYPLLSLSNRQWREWVYHYECTLADRHDTTVAMIRRRHSVLCHLARNNHDALLRWILSMRAARNVPDLLQRTKNRIVDRAARGGHSVLLKYCNEMWKPDAALVLHGLARGGHHDLLVSTYASFFGDGGGDEEDDGDPFHIDMVADAARGGHVDLVRYCRERWPYVCGTPWCADKIMRCAARGGHEPLVRLCLQEWGATDLLNAITSAAQGGYESFVRDHRDAVPDSILNITMISAGHGGHETIVRMCMEKWGPTPHTTTDHRLMRDVARTMTTAARKGHAHIVRMCYDAWIRGTDRQAKAVADSLSAAARGGHLNIMRICRDEWGAANLADAMRSAARGGHEHIVRMCHDEWGVTKVAASDDAMASAAVRGCERIVRLCYDTYGARDVNHLLRCAVIWRFPRIARIAHDEWGATDVEGAMLDAADHAYTDMVVLCYEWGARNIDEVEECALRRSDGPDIVSLCRQWRQEHKTKTKHV